MNYCLFANSDVSYRFNGKNDNVVLENSLDFTLFEKDSYQSDKMGNSFDSIKGISVYTSRPTYQVCHFVTNLISWPGNIHNIYPKIPKFLDTRNFAVIHLKFKQRDQTGRYFVKNMQME